MKAVQRNVLAQPIASPTREIWYDDVVAEVDLGLIEDRPAAWPAAAALERRAELLTERRGCGGSRVGRPAR